MGFSTAPSTSVARRAATTVLATIALSGAAFFLIKAATTNTGGPALVIRDHAGAQKVVIDDRGNASFSGSVKAGGVTLTPAGPSVNSGGVVTIGDNRYLKTAGGTMTGQEIIDLKNVTSGIGLKVLETASGNILHAEKDLTSSGALEVVGAVTLQNSKTCTNVQTSSTGLLSCNNTAYQTTALTDDSAWVGSSSNLAAATAIPSCSNGTTNALEYNTSTNAFSCVAISAGATYTGGRGINITSNVVTLNATLTGTTIRSFTTISGATVNASRILASSGSLKVLGNMSGAKLYTNNEINDSGSLVVKGAVTLHNTQSCTNIQASSVGLLSCNNTVYQTAALAEDNVWVGNGSAVASALPSCSGANNALLYNTSTNAFSCGTPAGTVYTGGQGITIASQVVKISSAFSGTTLTIYGTLSGNVLHAEKTLTSSGALKIVKNSVVLGTSSGNIIHAEKDLTSSGTLTALGAARFKLSVSGATLATDSGITIRTIKYYFPSARCTSGQVWTQDGNGTFACASAGGETDAVIKKSLTGSTTIDVSSTAEATYTDSIYVAGANTMVAGRSFEFTIRGTVTLGSGNTHTLRVYIGAVNPVAFNDCTATSTTCTFDETGWIEVVSTGASGKVCYHFEGKGKGNTTFTQTDLTTTCSTLDTTVANTIKVTGQIDASNGAFGSRLYKYVLRQYN